MTTLAPLDAATEAAADELHREALRALLVAAGGNVAAVARDLAKNGEPPQNARRRLDRRIAALGLRPWLKATYPGFGRVR